MSTIVVWVLFLSTAYGNVAVVDNIASRANCEALGKLVARPSDSRSTFRTGAMCVAVRKAKP